nr:hypothetical protein [uncultured Halomonas sp.]
MMRSSKAVATSLIVTASVLFPFAAQAYVGPGAGLSLLSALWGIIAAIGIALFFVLMWPIRRMMRRRKERLVSPSSQSTPTTPSPQPQAQQNQREVSPTSNSSDSAPPPSS